MSPRTAFASLGAALLCLSSCGLQAQAEAEAIEEVQYELLGTSTSTTSTTVPVAVAEPIFTVSLFWHTAGDNRLRQITRPLSDPPAPGQTLTDLVAGPTPEILEANPELQNQLDPTMEPVLTQLDDETFQIQIQWSEEQLTTEQAAEFVCTAVQFAEINAITIVNQDGVPFTLSGTGAVPIPGPASSSDFNDCVEDPLPVDPEALEPAESDDDAVTDEDGSTTTEP